MKLAALTAIHSNYYHNGKCYVGETLPLDLSERLIDNKYSGIYFVLKFKTCSVKDRRKLSCLHVNRYPSRTRIKESNLNFRNRKKLIEIVTHSVA